MITAEAALRQLTRFDLLEPQFLTIRRSEAGELIVSIPDPDRSACNDAFSGALRDLAGSSVGPAESNVAADNFIGEMFGRWHTPWLEFYQTKGGGLLLFWQTSKGIAPLSVFGASLSELMARARDDQFKCRSRLWCTKLIGHSDPCIMGDRQVRSHGAAITKQSALDHFPERLMSKS